MASKKTDKSASKKAKITKAKAALKATKTAKAPKKGPKVAVKSGPRHPHGRVVEKHTDKATLAKALAASVARADEDTDLLEARLKTASNQQLLRLQKAVTTVKDKWGNREKLIAAIGTANNKSKDKDYLARLDKYSLPQLIDLAVAAERRARA